MIPSRLTPHASFRLRGFTLLEVVIAMGILCIGTFAILALVSGTLANARRLQRPLVDASALVAQLSLTNQLVEGDYYGNLSDVLGKAYNEYKWTGTITEVGTNRLFQADFVIQYVNGPNHDVLSRTTTLFYRPQSPAGTMDGGGFGLH
jgi:prepilin-type N-terminal cleavage/methylation domain-containing protein